MKSWKLHLAWKKNNTENTRPHSFTIRFSSNVHQNGYNFFPQQIWRDIVLVPSILYAGFPQALEIMENLEIH